MNKLAIAMTMSALTIFALPCAAETKAMKKSLSKVAISKVSQSTFSNRDNNLGEKGIYKKILSDAKNRGVDLKEVEAKKISHIVNSALDNIPREAAAINIKIIVTLSKPIKIAVELSL